MDLSVIIPVYNKERYLCQCLDSVLRQNIEEMEIICVDDGSTDGSGELLDHYASLDARIRVIHKENSGLVQARKTGIQAATGKYTGYVDSDDWIEPEMYEVLYNIAEQYQADLVCSGYVWEKGMHVEFSDGFSEGLYQDKELDMLRDQIFFRESTREIGITPSLCNKLFRTSILKQVQMIVPDEVSNCEDRICTVAYVLKAETVYILKKAFYHYVFHRESMIHQEDAFYLDKLGITHRAFQFMQHQLNFSEKLRVQCELYMIGKVLDGLNIHMNFPVPDLMLIAPRWVEHFPEGSKIVLYGAGRLGKVYYRQISSDFRGMVQLVGWVDRNWQNLSGYPHEVQNPESIKKMDYDYVLLAFLDKQPAVEVRTYLTEELGVDCTKIVWLEQQNIFWEYAEAAGLFKSKGQ